MITIGNLELPNFPLILSPMEGITDAVFRRICKQKGADVVISEFIAADGLIRDIEKSFQKMVFNLEERPFGIQIFGNEVEKMRQATQIAETYKPDFIDINWGCPVKRVAGKGAGSGILKDIPKMLAITKACVEVAKTPITVKTRLGYDEHNKPIVSLSEQLQDIGIKALSIHGRTRSQMYKGAAEWSLIGEIMNNPRIKIPIFGNGDITSPEIALKMKDKYRVDGVLIGRASIGNPWIFEQTKQLLAGNKTHPPSIHDRVSVCRQHLLDNINEKTEKTAILEMRKHYAGYFKGLPDFKPYRISLMSLLDVDKILLIFKQIEDNYKFAEQMEN